MFGPLDGARNLLIDTWWLSVETLVVIEVVSIKAGIKCRVPTALESHSQQPVGVSYRVSGKRNEGTIDFLVK